MLRDEECNGATDLFQRWLQTMHTLYANAIHYLQEACYFRSSFATAVDVMANSVNQVPTPEVDDKMY